MHGIVKGAPQRGFSGYLLIELAPPLRRVSQSMCTLGRGEQNINVIQLALCHRRRRDASVCRVPRQEIRWTFVARRASAASRQDPTVATGERDSYRGGA